jgi:hypothetical protein
MTEKKPRLEVSPRHMNTRFGRAPAPIVSPLNLKKAPSPILERELDLSEIGIAPSTSNRSTISN